MSDLIVYLPESPPGASTDYRYAQSRDGQTVAHYGSAPATALPQAGLGQDVVVIVPGRLLSWHRLDLPKGTLTAGATRLRAVLDGMMEERVLDEPGNLHFAVAPQATTPGGVWVAACDKAWLQAALAPLEAAGRPVSRIVPEFAPLPAEGVDDGAATVYATGDPSEAWLVQPHPDGVASLPLQAAVVSAWRSRQGAAPFTVRAEPALIAQATALFEQPVQLQQAADRWLQALSSPWNLAQFDLANSGRQRVLKKFSDIGADLLHAPRWRAARWGMGLALAVNLAGLNAWAWKEQAALSQRRSAVQAVLTQTFPHVKVVLDAPLQMARELALLRQSTGAATQQDLENLLTAWGSAQVAPSTPEASGIHKLDYSDGELRLQGTSLTEEALQGLRARLDPLGYALRRDGEALVLTALQRGGSTR